MSFFSLYFSVNQPDVMGRHRDIFLLGSLKAEERIGSWIIQITRTLLPKFGRFFVNPARPGLPGD